MAHAQKPDFIFRRKGRVHLNRRGRQFIRLLAAEVCASAVVMLDTPCSEVAWEYWLPTPFVSFPFTPPPVRHNVPSGFNRTLTLGPMYLPFRMVWNKKSFIAAAFQRFFRISAKKITMYYSLLEHANFRSVREVSRVLNVKPNTKQNKNSIWC